MLTFMLLEMSTCQPGAQIFVLLIFSASHISKRRDVVYPYKVIFGTAIPTISFNFVVIPPPPLLHASTG